MTQESVSLSQVRFLEMDEPGVETGNSYSRGVEKELLLLLR